ncbi:ABC transporter family substrate-binding protein [Microbacterium sp. CnD16-F]|uniref:ABC transporter family substrate-binding protein n=1 Tax=Microbacterium TaxID=33882 RepID=UPI00209699AA|nr:MULTISPECIES: ABC transporter family substrate-binding protein [unclassified Microbacterium]MCO7201920.1 ABC transporter family substrate-binding protein [Microbacterium sp. CnD16-F]MDT0179292.1 ABC transporter family substrate-binding protein [Microbacterium sp. ARD31]
MIRKTALAGLAVLSAGALMLTACAGGTTSSPSPSSSASPESLPLVGYEEVSYGDLTDGGNLNLSVTSSPTDEGSWNPNHALAANVDVQKLLEPTLSSMWVIAEDGSWTANPDYATSIELTSEEPQVVTVKLNESAVWPDGSPITAEDYAATYAAAGGAEEGYEVVPSSVFDAIDSVDVVSDFEYTVSFTGAYADWPSLFSTPVLPADIANDKEAFNSGFASEAVPSAGPYVVDEIDNSAKIFKLVPNPNWWGANAPKLDSITFKVIAQETLPQAYANDEIDSIEIQTPDALETASGKEGAVVGRSGGVTWSHLTFNATAAPFDDVNVRKAVGMAIDRELIARVANEPLGAPATTLGDWIFMPGQAGYSDVFGEVIGSDTDAAESLLEEAGWTKGDDGWTKDGETLTFAITVPAGTQSNINRALGVQDSLARIGVEVTLNEVPSENYFTNIDAGDFQAVTFGWQGTLFPISSAETIYTPADSPQNYAGVTDDRLAGLWEQANAELDEDARLGIAKEINEVIADFLPSVPIYPYPEVVATDEGLANYGTATFKNTDWTLVGYTE